MTALFSAGEIDLDGIEEAMQHRVSSGWMTGDARIALKLTAEIRRLQGNSPPKIPLGEMLHVERFRDVNSQGSCRGSSRCRKAGSVGHFCAEHYQHVLEVTQQILAPYGLVVRKVTTNDGYLQADVFTGNSKTRPVHRLVMEAELGRALIGTENVHHINGNRADNRASNLELWSVSQPAGQRPADLAAYAREILKLYGTDTERRTYL